ncbi:hypothetical protein Anas_05763 [Armadillidium nasatum]|uniref:Uncharacterized protein n=1 Tax=Armadillidium nasatum TaxID=96803 RepID=A0A5N5SM86_9CRUS|nr:hypothetical protein Anas_05763 [Armadillidium nasatum]
MSGSIEHEYEQVIDAFASEDVEEIVHVINNEDVHQAIDSKETGSDNGDEEAAILVPPLLTTGRDQERIPISVEEMKRRIEPPESL